MQRVGRVLEVVRVTGKHRGDEPSEGNSGEATDARWQAVLVAVLSSAAAGLVAAAQSAEVNSKPETIAACITLEAAAAHGYVDDVGYRRIIRSLTTESNPYRDVFPPSYREFVDACRTLRARADAKASTIRTQTVEAK